jgi:hypothetical protein
MPWVRARARRITAIIAGFGQALATLGSPARQVLTLPGEPNVPILPDMRKLILALTGALVFPVLASAQASASASLDLRLNLPVVLPQLVVVTPGVMVVPEVDEEVFFVDGFYWVRQPRGWYRSKSHKHGWVLVPARRVPSRLVSFPPGQYKRWKPAKHERRDDDRGHHDHGRGNGKSHGKHGGKHGKD